jgi:hypothetical protein
MSPASINFFFIFLDRDLKGRFFGGSLRPVEKNQCQATFFNPRFSKIKMDHPPLKAPLFVEHGRSREIDNKPFFNFHMKKAVLRI